MKYVVILFFAYFIYRVVSRAFQLKLLIKDGQLTTGRVCSKRKYMGKHGRGGMKSLRYEYTDSFGRTRANTSLVPESIWESYDEGSPIEVIYSQSKPAISAPKYLVDQANSAFDRPS